MEQMQDPPPTIELRTADDDDYAAMVALYNACRPEYPQTVEEWRLADQAIAGRYFRQRLVAEAGGAVVAYGCVEEFRESRVSRFMLEIMVAPRWRRRGVGGRVYERLVEIARQQGARSLIVQTWEDQPEAVRFLEARGFAVGERAPISSLDVPRFDDALAVRAMQRVAASGVVIRSVAALQAEEPQWMRRLYDLCIAVERDMPSIDPFEPQPFEVWQPFLESPTLFHPQAWYVAVDGDAWVGVTGMRPRAAAPETLHTHITGVVGSHRRRGIATALKVSAIRWARRCGYTRIDTDNEENNPMYQINLVLGFEPRPAELNFTRDL